MDRELDEQLISAWVRLTGILKNTRITKGLVYNEAIVMLTAYRRYRKDGVGLVSFKELVQETRMMKSLVNRTINSLVEKEMLVRCEGEDRRMTFVKLVPQNLDTYLAVHEQSLALATQMRETIGDEDAEAFVRIAEKIASNSAFEHSATDR